VIDLDALNPPQREAVTHTGSPLLVLAGAGSGKTRVLTFRIAHLVLDRGVRPEEILAVTFTNKAAREMRERLEVLLGERARALTVGTFHAVCARWLRREAPRIGLPPSFAIYDDADTLSLCKRALADLDVSEEAVPPQALRSFLDRRKNAADALDAGSDARTDPMVRAAMRYEELLARAGATDFGGLILGMVRVLSGDDAVRDRYRDRYRHVLVDEYQDINRAQYVLLQRLAARSPDLAVVGDDDQAIYGFRGATVRAILDFERDHPEAKIVRLEQNYRSSGNILGAASAVIRRNAGRHGKRLWTDRGEGEKVIVATLPDDRAEAHYAVGEVAGALARGHDLSEVAICYRTNAQSRILEEELVRRGHAYVLVGGTRFYDRKEVKDALAYLRVLVNPSDDVSLVRIVNVPTRGIGATTVAALAAAARERGGPISSVLEAIAAGESVPGLATTSRARVREFRDLLSHLRDGLGACTLAETVEQVLQETGLVARLRAEGTEEAEVRADNLDELVSAARELDALEAAPVGGLAVEAFLERAALVSDLDAADGRRSAVTLMTLHNSKGLEFPVVVLTGMEEGLFPHKRAIDEGDVEEERRLCYVGMTRARERLVLTRARHRVLFGVSQQNPPSRFLREIDGEYVEMLGGTLGSDAGRGAAGWRTGPRSTGLPELPWARERGLPTEVARVAAAGAGRGSRAADGSTTIDYTYGQDPGGESVAIRPGTRVRHAQFGPGVVRWVEGAGESTKVTVQFERAGTRKLLLRFAPLEVVA
jgi:DNA helicase-2/ATP-dependent DNA helicase PcrA